MAKISVILYTTNQYSRLKLCIDSILQQKYQDFELEIVVDSSYKETKEILKEYEETPKLKIHSITSTGKSKYFFWLQAAKDATGDYIWIINDYCWAHELFLEQVLGGLITYQEADLAFCKTTSVDKYNRAKQTTPRKIINGVDYFSKSYLHRGTYDLQNSFDFENPIADISSFIFKRTNFVKLDESVLNSLNYAGEWYIYREFLKNNKVLFIAQELMFCSKTANLLFQYGKTKAIKELQEYLDLIENSSNPNCSRLNYHFHDWLFESYFKVFRLNLKTFKIFKDKRNLFQYFLKVSTVKLADYLNLKTANIIDKIYKAEVRQRFKSTPLPPEHLDPLVIKGDTNKSVPIPKIIWLFWESPEGTTPIEPYLDNWRKYCPEYKISIVSNTNLQELLPDFPVDADFPSIQYRSDLIRLGLLKEYGGFWIDVFTIFTESLEWLRNLQIINNVDYVGFYNPFYSNINSETPIIENWIMGSVPRSEFITKWYKSLLDTINSKKYFAYYKVMSNYENIKQYIPGYFENYLNMHFACQHVLSGLESKYPMALISCSDEGLFYRYATWPMKDTDQIREFLIKNKTAGKISKIIKLTGGDRYYVQQALQKNTFSKKSIVGKYLGKN